MEYDLGYFDLESRVLEPLEIPSAQKCHLCLRYVVSPMSAGRPYILNDHPATAFHFRLT